MASQSKYKSEGKTIDHTPAGSLTAGDVTVVGNRLIGAPQSDIAAGEPGTLRIGGQHDIAKEATTTTFAVGDPIFWDDNANQAVASPNTTTRLYAICVKAAAATDAYVRGQLLDDVSPIEYLTLYIGDLAADADTAAMRAPAHPAGGRLVSVDVCFHGASAGVDNANTSVHTVTDQDGNTIVTKTYNTATQPPNGQESLGTCDLTHGVLAARESPRVTITNGGTANLPAMTYIFGYLPNR